MTPKLLKYAGIPVTMILVSMTFFTPIPATIRLIIRIFLIPCFFILWKYFSKRDLIEAGDLSFTLFVLNLAFLVAMPFTSGFWNLKEDSPEGFALIKLSDSAIISTVIIATFLFAGYNLKNIYLAKGRLLSGLLIGILFFFLFAYLALKNPQQKPDLHFVRNQWPWVLLFVLSNGFMEELIYRGVFFEKLIRLYKSFWSVILTSVCFALPHLTVIYQPNAILFAGICFILGIICGYAMLYTRSIIAPAIIHAGADLMIIVPVFASYGVSH